MKNMLYTYSEAVAKLGGMAPSTFSRLVKAGKIKKIVPPNKKHGLYSKEDVDKLAAAMHQFINVYSIHDNVEFSQAQSDKDIKATVQIAHQNFGDLSHTLENRLEWFHTAPEGEYILKENGVIVGYISMQPIRPEAIDDHIYKPNGGMRMDDVIPFSTEQLNECYVSAIATRVEPTRKHERWYGALLIMNMADMLVQLAEKDIFISKIWAKSQTVTGISLARELGFEELGMVNHEQIGFVLNLSTAKHPLLKSYKDMLKKKLSKKEKAQDLLDFQGEV